MGLKLQRLSLGRVNSTVDYVWFLGWAVELTGPGRGRTTKLRPWCTRKSSGGGKIGSGIGRTWVVARWAWFVLFQELFLDARFDTSLVPPPEVQYQARHGADAVFPLRRRRSGDQCGGRSYTRAQQHGTCAAAGAGIAPASSPVSFHPPLHCMKGVGSPGQWFLPTMPPRRHRGAPVSLPIVIVATPLSLSLSPSPSLPKCRHSILFLP